MTAFYDAVHPSESSVSMTTIRFVAMYSLLNQIAKFVSVGVLNTLLDAIIYLTLTRRLGLASLPILAKGASYSVGILNSFCWNKVWIFKSQANTVRAFALFVLSNCCALVINASVMHIGLNVMRLPDIVALALATASTLVWNFAVNKLIIFKT